MSTFKSFLVSAALVFGYSASAQAITITYNFTGECDDCAYSGNPGDPGFNPLNDGLTQTVTASLELTNIDVDNGMIDYRGAGTVTFNYHGSSLLNPFSMSDPYLFTSGLMTSGTVANGAEFVLASSVNTTDPNNPLNFNFPNFCTATGEQVLGLFNCNGVGLVNFRLDSDGNWEIGGEFPSDIGSAGNFTAAVPVPAALPLFLAGLFSLYGFSRKTRK